MFCFGRIVRADNFSRYKDRKEVSMAKYNRNSGKAWSKPDEAKLIDLAKHNTPTRVIGLKLGRTEDAVRSKASDLDVSLKPTNQSPYTPSQ
jgi:hypothetical protein